MNKLLLLLALYFFSAQSFAAGCPDGSEPVKSISDDGTYFVYNCGGGNEQSSSSSNTNSNAGTVKVSIQDSTKSGNWFPTDGLPMWTPHYAKFQLVFTEISKSYTAGPFAIADFDNDGVDDFFVITNPKQPGVDWDSVGPACLTELGECYSKAGSISVYKVEQTKTKWVDDGVENGDDWTSATYKAIDVTGLLVDENPIEMKGTDGTDIHVADFNGDGKVDVFATQTTQINKSYASKNDMYFLSNEGRGWTESTATHVTGTGVRNGKGLINFSHGSTVGDIDGDGDIDIIVTSINWHHVNRGEIFCYINNGSGHMKVRKCGKQWGFTSVLGDMDGDGDLDLVWGSDTMEGVKEWNKWDTTSGCDRGPATKKCTGAFNGILYNDGKGNFYERGFEFENPKNSTGFYYVGVPGARVSDLDGDGDLDVIRSHIGHNYAGAGMTIEENLGNGKFKTAFYSEFCATPKTKEAWPRQEGNEYNCWVSDYKFGDFNKDGLIDIYLDGHDANNSDTVRDGAIYMSTGKFTYDILWPSPAKYPGGFKPVDENYPLIEMKIKKQPKAVVKVLTTEEKQQSVEDELAAFEAELAAELGQ
ncbi:FG-GAP-like repeat-containing protein [Candidatus Thioglobus sp.]|nr:FG-GAP-like repeat-containing protein [Candidatus Thioglobus sp.]